MRRFLCNLFGHRRHARRARPSIDGWRAPCRLCGQRMVRVAPGQWRLLSEHDGGLQGPPRRRDQES